MEALYHVWTHTEGWCGEYYNTTLGDTVHNAKFRGINFHGVQKAIKGGRREIWRKGEGGMGDFLREGEEATTQAE